MGLLAEIADRMDKDERLRGFPHSKRDFRCGSARSFDGTQCHFDPEADAIARAVIEAVAEYEEVEVEECRAESSVLRGDHWLRMSDDRFLGQAHHNPVPRTILLKKLAPEPTVEELARAAAVAWHKNWAHKEFDEAMTALAERLDKS